MIEYLLTFVIALVASILSGIAGGGAGLITSPLFMLFGMPPHIAIATAKFGGLGITLGGFLTFRKTKLIRWSYVFYLSLLAAIASVVGSFWLVHTEPQTVEKLTGFLMLGSLPLLFFRKGSEIAAKTVNLFRKVIGGILFFIISIIQAGFGGGIGTLIPVIMMRSFGFTPLEANATRKVPGMVIAIVSLSVFMLSGIVEYTHGIVALIGTIAGSSLGTHIAIKKGDVFVRNALVCVVFVLAVKLLFF